LPFTADLTTPEAGSYLGKMAAAKAEIVLDGQATTLKNVGLTLESLPPESKRPRLVKAAGEIGWMGATARVVVEAEPAGQRVRRGEVRLQSADIAPLASEAIKIGRFALPFSASGPVTAFWRMEGPIKNLNHRGEAAVNSLSLHFPMKTWRVARSVDLTGLAGRVEWSAKAGEKPTLEIHDAVGQAFGGKIRLSGAGHLLRSGPNGWTPGLDRVAIAVEEIGLGALHALLGAGFYPPAVAERLRSVDGRLSGELKAQGSHRHLSAEGDVRISSGTMRWEGLGDPITDLSGRIRLGRRGSAVAPHVEIDQITARFRRSEIGLERALLQDPAGRATLQASGTLVRVFPEDVMKLLDGLDLPRISFPKENALTGTVGIAGSLDRPRLHLDLAIPDLTVDYRSGSDRYAFPIGRSQVALDYDSGSGRCVARRFDLGVLGGRITLNKGEGRIAGGRPASFLFAGTLEGIDLGTVVARQTEGLRGVFAGTFKGEQKEKGAREADFHLDVRNLLIPVLPVEPAVLEAIGLEMLKRPDIRTGRVNLYVSTDPDETETLGQLRLADGLFAGPFLRLELDNSAFDPRRLELVAKLQFNPQGLRQTTLGKKVGKHSALLQDEGTGIPYVDLSVSGSWDNPSLLGRAITKRAEKRGKRNFIKRLFGGRRPHKASVAELEEWFPGWKPGMTLNP
jgi:hypothetical protein